MEPGAFLVREGDEDPSMLLILSGTAEVHSGGTLLGTAGPGDLVGEMALFAGGTRSASVTATSRCEIGVLNWNGYDALRRREHPVASVIEQRGLRTLADRLAAIRLQIAAMVVEPEPRLPFYQAGFGAWVVATAARWGLGPAAARDPRAQLASSALFAGIPKAVIAELASRMRAGVWSRGHVWFRQGDPSAEVGFLGSGRVELFRTTPAGGWWRMGSVFAGQAVGAGALAAGGGARALTAVVRRRVVGWTLDQAAWAELEARKDAVGSGLRVVMIRALAEQLAVANRQLASLDQDDPELARQARAQGGGPW